MEPRGIVFTPQREQAGKQHPFNDKKRAAETKAKRHPQTPRYRFTRADHGERDLYDGPINPERMEGWRRENEND